MLSTLLVCCAFLGAGRGEGGTSVDSSADRPAYERALKEAGRDAGAHVRLALWCEAHGMSAERMKHLALAVMYDPSNALARGLLGLVAHQGKWGAPEEIGRKIKDDPAYRQLIEEYLQRRAQAPNRADAQMKLASWCDQKGLKAQAIAHYNLVVQLDPSRESAWKHLGYKKQGNRWVKPEEAAAEKLEAERQRRADKTWRERLEKMRDGLAARDPARKARAERALAGVTDPRAVPMIWAVFISGGSERLQLAAVQMLGQIDGPAASTALATLSILDPQGAVRARAAETLMRRDPRDIVGRLIALVRKPFTYKVKPIDGPGATGELFIEGDTFNVRRVYRSRAADPGLIPPGSFAPSATADPLLPPDASPARGAARAVSSRELVFDPLADLVAQAFASAASTPDLRAARRLDVIRQDNQVQRERLAADVREVEATNARIRELNGRVLPMLATLTGRDMGAEPQEWKAWWTDQLGYAFQKQSPTTKPTFTEVVDSPRWSASLECFAAGTPVHTIDGPRAIESIRVGDRVLSQDTSTGVLGFQPVLAIHQTRSAATVRVSLDGETVVATGIHRFWKAGQGWVNARDLKPGDRVRALGAVIEVKGVDAAPSQPVYNLDVAGNHDFLVGKKGFLVHDSNFVKPVPAPFDRGAALAASPSREE
jgi:tetratricopeptide (TPR) repeat protein